MFGIFASLAEFERELIRERTIAGLASAQYSWACWRKKGDDDCGQNRLAQAAMGRPETIVADLAKS